jgi:hypothetical protein
MVGNVPPFGSVEVHPSVLRFVTTKANALIIGDRDPIIRVLNIVWPTLRKPIVHCAGRRLLLPVDHEGTLVIGDAQQLVERDQHRLLEWWDSGARQTRIIACASPQLFAFVEDGAFSRCLFDRFKDVPSWRSPSPAPIVGRARPGGLTQMSPVSTASDICVSRTGLPALKRTADILFALSIAMSGMNDRGAKSAAMPGRPDSSRRRQSGTGAGVTGERQRGCERTSSDHGPRKGTTNHGHRPIQSASTPVHGTSEYRRTRRKAAT